MSIRCSGVASRSFIIGSRECPPARRRASGPSRCEQLERVVDAGRALVLERCRDLHGLSSRVACERRTLAVASGRCASNAIKRSLMRRVGVTLAQLAVVRHRGPAGVREGGRGRARASPSRRSPWRSPRCAGSSATSSSCASGRGIALTRRRAAARRARERDPRPRRAGRAAPSPDGPGERPPAAGRGDRRRRPSTCGPLRRRVRRRATPNLEIALEAAPGASVRRPARAPAGRHRARPAPGPDRAATIASVPFLRCRLVVVAAPRHPLAGAPRHRAVGAGGRALARRAARASTRRRRRATTGARNGLAPRDVGAYASHAAAIAAAAAGDGVVLTLAPLGARRAARAHARARSTCAGRRSTELWHASTLGLDRALPVALSAAALRDDARGDAGDVRRPRRDDVRPRAARGARDVVALRRRVAAALALDVLDDAHAAHAAGGGEPRDLPARSRPLLGLQRLMQRAR